MRPVRVAVLCLLDNAVYATRKSCSVVFSCLGNVVQKLVTDVNLVYLDVESPQEFSRPLSERCPWRRRIKICLERGRKPLQHHN